ncbi:hypothetical protein N7U66_06870 [Lacinutrix neustonica]|uniref:Uncharacterized protein n=1 Tax=Lacinutrix neustonica TaxID=2980107 RepID=A0A9E8MXP4_9FLAO|nr:hypothetical protein [Lacinutrix neustonica]WAC03281.1 hypothetical protein N7U66_06870 [Lacinutrix neustonica]
MTRTFAKHITLNLISLAICFVFTSGISSFAQQPPLNKAPTLDSTRKQHDAAKKQKKIDFDGRDGPYIINDSLLYRVNAENKLVVSPIVKDDSLVVRSDHKNSDVFYVSIASHYDIPKTTYQLPRENGCYFRYRR